MATYYVGLGGDDTALGTSWATRLLTLNAAEDAHAGGTPKNAIAAGDTVYVGPRVYRELLTCDVSGGAGTPITYIGDVTGQNTDGVGGIVRVTGSDNDTTATRANCITATSINYRTFRGFCFDTTTSSIIALATSCGNWIIEDCISGGTNANSNVFAIAGTGTTNTVRRCVFFPTKSSHMYISHSVTVDNAAHLVEDCLFIGSGNNCGINIGKVGGITVKNCTFIGSSTGVNNSGSPAAGQTIQVNNCLFAGVTQGLAAAAAGFLVENYNNFWCNGTDRNASVGVGANSTAYPILFNPPILSAGYRFPWFFGELSQWSALRGIAGTGMSADDLFGMTRTVTDAKKSWGAIQYNGIDRSATQAHAGTYSLRLADAGRVQFQVPVTAVNTTFSVYVYREADYAGTNPQMIIKQPGVADNVVLDANAAAGWNELTVTLAPAALPGYVIVELVSNNTAVAGNYKTYFDDLVIT